MKTMEHNGNILAIISDAILLIAGGIFHYFAINSVDIDLMLSVAFHIVSIASIVMVIIINFDSFKKKIRNYYDAIIGNKIVKKIFFFLTGLLIAFIVLSISYWLRNK